MLFFCVAILQFTKWNGYDGLSFVHFNYSCSCEIFISLNKQNLQVFILLSDWYKFNLSYSKITIIMIDKYYIAFINDNINDKCNITCEHKKNIPHFLGLNLGGVYAFLLFGLWVKT